ncbi:glycosyltransferase family 117 protein [Mucilaginibacter auburnensis]|uniref:Uncharacterized protein DUF2723 n=1 Tax=Mucilaginibacter auburnensis TaxID=1457233 RepID=A0A2H9VU50_9SPHI|nr:DUF2723 domain-containing protein [Mucilaginibacter auburnensis]PJJ84356.1 uncharacterized protein DUF2723 [Mucilaginibacter auburnensis]
MQYKKLNNILGWLCFAIAAVTYTLTLEPSVSFWDCGEFISCAYRLQVSHQPGYPLFAMLGKVFSLLSFGDRTKVAYFTNMGSAMASAATVMFLFWTITALAKKLLSKTATQWNGQQQTMLIMGAGLTGALCFAFSDTFWFSAVETIVFALSALCTSVVFWAIMKWDGQADEPDADKWLIFIAYIIGLSIGIHLLNLLTIPAITLVYFNRRNKVMSIKKVLIAFAVSVVILALVQFGIRQYTIKAAAYVDLYFVNSLGFGFNIGAILFFVLLVMTLAAGIIYSIKKQKPGLNLALLCVAFIYFGYGSFVYIPIRATANTNLNNSNPDNAFTLNSYLNRDQYGQMPLLYGPYFDAEIVERKDAGKMYIKGEKRYEESGVRPKYVFDHNTFFPRIYSRDGDDPQFYRQWQRIPEDRAPNFIDNIGFFLSWQTYQMYVRYFMWNFAGRVNEMDGQQRMGGLKGYVNGDWTTGILDGFKQLPKSVTSGTNYMPLYGLPLAIGLLGMWFHFRNSKRDALVVVLLWFFTGMAIVLYVNQPAVQPRERDYSYVCSFYAFAIWVGLGVIALATYLKKWLNENRAIIGSIAATFLLVPVLMACTEWRGHDRSTKTVARDMAYNYLISCPPNAILFTYGDNDTYPLWYAQEVENIRPDVRVVNISLLSADWYIRQMQGKMNESAPLPITMPFNKYKTGVRDVVFYRDNGEEGSAELSDIFKYITSDSTAMKGQSGAMFNILPTKNLKITLEKNAVIENNVLSAGQTPLLADSLVWQYNADFVMKDDLAILDILAHNNWKRPVCFTVTIGNGNLVGLQNYLYREGFTYRLLPLKPDTSLADQTHKVNTQVMYNNLMNKFRFGNYKHARYLDDESRTMFYAVTTAAFTLLAEELIKEGRSDLAVKVIRKYDSEMPAIFADMRSADTRLNVARLAYQLQQNSIAQSMANGIITYVTDILDYNARQLHGGTVNSYNVEEGIKILTELSRLNKEHDNLPLAKTLENKVKGYNSAFEKVLAKAD